MGRGQGGSISYGKRTPGGIKTSSAMQMSRIGEVEAKHGVLGDDRSGANPGGASVDKMQNLVQTKLGGQKGGNPGGTFQSADGKKNYVKVYRVPGQAYGEAVAGSVYNALGLRAPKSVMFDPEAPEETRVGRGIANEYIDGKTLDEYGVTPEIANKILDGAAADILLGNWDTIGLSNDNIVVTPEGEPARIDNGGALLYRALGSPKPNAVLNKITEWDVFANDGSKDGASNPSYSEILHTAGYNSFDDIKPRLQEQVRKINEVAAKTNDFDDLVLNAPGVNQQERSRILEMLRARRKLLNEKVGLTDELQAVVQEQATPQQSATGEKQTMASAAMGAPKYSDTFVKNAGEHNMSPDEWKQHVDSLASKMTATTASGDFEMNDESFNKELGDLVINNMKEQRNNGVRKGAVTFLPNKGKAFILGDTHERFDNVIAIYEQIQSNAGTNLDMNPDNKIILNGDAFSMSKEGQENGQVGSRGSLRGEAMLRLLTYLMARHPDQVFMTNGNHEMGVLLALKSRQDPSWRSVRSSGNNFKDLPREQLGVSNIKLLIDLIQNNGLAVAIGDKSKGETARIITHTAGENREQPTAAEMANESDPMQWREKYYPVYNGWSDLTPAGLQKGISKTGSDKRYFGHVDPSTMKEFMGDDAEAVDDRQTPVGAYKGGGVFVDTQTGGKNSGYIEVDLDKDHDTVHRMDEVFANYSPGKLHEAIAKVAQMSVAKSTTPDDEKTRWLK